MPRLIGKQSNPGIPLSLLVLASIATITGLEYVGAINIVNEFGNDRLEIRSYPSQPTN